nr:hypothetical protein [Tanacetum cinerariifolium]
MNEDVKIAIQLQSNKLRNEAQAENEDFINKLDEYIKKIIKEQVKEQVKAQVSKILPKIEKTVNEQLETKVLTHSSSKSKTSHTVAANLSELELKRILIDKMERNKSIHISDEQKNLYKALVDAYESDKLILDTYGDTRSKKRRAGKEPESTSAPKEKTSKSAGKSKEWSKSHQEHNGKSTKAEEPIHADKELEEPAHQEFDTGSTEEQIVVEITEHPDCNLARKDDSRDSFNELRDTLLDFSAFMMNRLKVDTLTPELLAELHNDDFAPFCFHLVSFFYFLCLIKSRIPTLVELEYFLEEVFKATTDKLYWNNLEGQQYPHDLHKPLPLIPNSRVAKTKAADYGHIKWIEDLVLNAIIIAVTKLQIVEWHNYKHLDWITVRRDDDRLYTFKEGNFNRLRIQDIKDMLLLLVQGKLTNLTVEERLAFNVSLRMFTRSIVIQRRVEDLSYQNNLNLTNPDTYNQILNERKLIQHTPILEGIQMKYLPQTIWRQSDRDKARAMIQAIDKQIKTRRIMWSLEKFVDGRPYEGDFRLLQRTI